MNCIVKLLHDLVLLQCIICWKIPLVLRYGPRDSLRLGLYNPFITQGIEKIVLWMKEKVLSSLTGPMLRANYKAVLIHISIGGKQLFRLDFDTFRQLLSQIWIKSLWQFVRVYGIDLPSTGQDLELAREGDKFLIESFSRYFSKKQLIILN